MWNEYSAIDSYFYKNREGTSLARLQASNTRDACLSEQYWLIYTINCHPAAHHLPYEKRYHLV